MTASKKAPSNGKNPEGISLSNRALAHIKRAQAAIKLIVMACALMGADITFAHLSANDMGAVSVGHSEQSQTGTLQSTVQATHITAHAGRDASVQASQLRADQNITLSAQRNTYLVAAAQLDQNTSHTNSNINSTVLAMEDKTRADTRTTEGVRIFV